MKHQIVFLRLIVLFTFFLFVLPPPECQAQRNASRKVEKELFGKTRKNKPFDDRIKVRGAAGRAMKEQDKKEAKRDREDEKKLRELRKRHYNVQSDATKERMDNNSKNTKDYYKAKKQKRRKEQTRPRRRIIKR